MVALLVVLASVYAAFALTRMSSEVVARGATPQGHLPASRIDLDITPVAVDPLSDEVEIEATPVLHGDVGTTVGAATRAREAFSLIVDGAQPPEQKFSAGQAVDRFTARVGITEGDPLADFPLDRYHGEVDATARKDESSGSAPIPVVVYPEPPGVEGFNMTFSRPAAFSPQAALASGDWRTALFVERDGDVRFITLLIGLVLICSAVAVLAVAFTIVIGRRKISTDMLAWMAIFPFALIAARDVIPGGPPVGVDFDVIAYYWAIAAAFISLLGCVVKWLLTPGAE